MSSDLRYQSFNPQNALTDFVESFWVLHNATDTDKEIIILPDGRIDLVFVQSMAQPFQVIRLGIGTRADRTILAAQTKMFAISFKLLVTEYLFKKPLPYLLDCAEWLSDDFWGFKIEDLSSFDHFTKTASKKILRLLPQSIDSRKQRLFHLIYESSGQMTVKELEERASWSSRQINRYFNQQFGISLKVYCNILRFRASFNQIKDGNLYPQQDFSDQSHFIKEIKRFSGALPKELKCNKNDRFIQFSTLPEA